jgi:hypothetical protein
MGSIDLVQFFPLLSKSKDRGSSCYCVNYAYYRDLIATVFLASIVINNSKRTLICSGFQPTPFLSSIRSFSYDNLDKPEDEEPTEGSSSATAAHSQELSSSSSGQGSFSFIGGLIF